MVFEFALLGLVLTAIVAILVYTLITGVPPVPTTPRVRATMMALVPDDFRGIIYELGAGWGGLAFSLARRFPDCRIVAYELSPLPWAFTRLRQVAFPCPNLTVRRADYRRVSLTPASLVMCYLFPAGMARLRGKFEAELATGTLIVSNTFAVPGWRPAAVRRAHDLYASTVYLYVMPHCALGDEGQAPVAREVVEVSGIQ